MNSIWITTVVLVFTLVCLGCDGKSTSNGFGRIWYTSLPRTEPDDPRADYSVAIFLRDDGEVWLIHASQKRIDGPSVVVEDTLTLGHSVSSESLKVNAQVYSPIEGITQFVWENDGQIIKTDILLDDLRQTILFDGDFPLISQEQLEHWIKDAGEPNDEPQLPG